jgi:membrane peptidoglycan carboxypeptidase
LALANGFSPTTLLISEETDFNIEDFGIYSPKNATNKYANGEIDMIQAIALSDNIYALKTLLLLGSDNLVRLLKSFGIEEVSPLPSLALGTVSTSLLKLTSIYNTFASLGKYYSPKFIDKIYDFNNNIIYSSSSNYKQILDTSKTLILNQMLTSTFDSSLTSYQSPTMANYKPYNIYAAKSGTTKSDSYVLAYNPNYTIGIWVGSDSNQQLDNYPLPKILFKKITEILENKKEPSWYSPNHQTLARRYNPNTHSFDNTGKVYYFQK